MTDESGEKAHLKTLSAMERREAPRVGPLVCTAEAKVYLALADESPAYKPKSINRDFQTRDAIHNDARFGGYEESDQEQW